MKIIILEGIATSGKTSVRKELEILFNKKSIKYVFVDEEETLMPVLNNKYSEIAEKHILSVLQKSLSLEVDLIIFDRLYLTHLWRTNSSPEIFKESENILINNNTVICFLQIPEEVISERIKLALSHRDDKWGEYVQGKGQTFEDVVSYYRNQQKDLLKILNNIKIKNHIFSTQDMNFEKIAQEIELLVS
jgi:thymidylate kinase